MRIAALSDIHGNVWALEAVLADIRRCGADLVVDLGDILSGPLAPAATADLLMPLSFPTIRGNHERQLLDCARRPGGASDQFAFEHTTPAHRDWLASLPATLALGDAADGVFLCHGTPASDLVYFLERVDERGAAMAAADEIARHADGVPHSLILCGHSHQPRTIALAGGRLVVNPGSVGLQAFTDDHGHPHRIENGSPHARYAICERGPHGWNVEQRCVAYAWDEAAAAAARHGRPDWARWLETGRA